MELSTIVDLITSAQQGEDIALWRGYAIRDIPFAVYDDDNVVYINHPNPPEKRPQNLMAATSVDINGVQTATIPTWVCEDESTALPIAYHEGFHVFQYHQFKTIEPDMFTAMAFYPDLNLEYRVLCRLEVDVLRKTDWLTERKLSTIGALTALRREQLKVHDSLSGYERFLERNEGTAKYIEQKARLRHFNIKPMIGDVGHGWLRFYEVGAGLCWLLDDVAPDWFERVEQGESPGDIVLEFADKNLDLEQLGYSSVFEDEKQRLQAFREEIAPELEKFKTDAITQIRYPSDRQVYRAFSPATMVSLGDGRILHRSFFKLLMPERGSVSLDIPVIDDIANHQVILPVSIDYQLENGQLTVDTDTIQINLSGVAQTSQQAFVCH